MKRIEQAGRLLSNTNEKILMIAYECGYTDMKHFNSIFKKIMGTINLCTNNDFFITSEFIA